MKFCGHGYVILLSDRGREREREKHRFVIPLTFQWLSLVCALTRDQTHNLDVWGGCSNQLSHPPRDVISFLGDKIVQIKRINKINLLNFLKNDIIGD